MRLTAGATSRCTISRPVAVPPAGRWCVDVISRSEANPTGQPLCHETPVMVVRSARGIGVMVALKESACAAGATSAAATSTRQRRAMRCIPSLCLIVRRIVVS